MSLYRGYEPARRCTTGPTPGARALMSVFLGLYAARGGTNLGIYQCATIPGSTAISLHGEGRATDLGIPAGGRGFGGWGQQLAERLRLHSAEMGVQLVIYSGQVWSGRYPDSGWRDYDGIDPHDTHIHAELCWWAAEHFTPAHFAPYLMDQPAPAPAREGEPMFVVRKLVPGQPESWWFSNGIWHVPVRDGDDLDFFRGIATRPEVTLTTESDFQGRAGVRAA